MIEVQMGTSISQMWLIIMQKKEKRYHYKHHTTGKPPPNLQCRVPTEMPLIYTHSTHTELIISCSSTFINLQRMYIFLKGNFQDDTLHFLLLFLPEKLQHGLNSICAIKRWFGFSAFALWRSLCHHNGRWWQGLAKYNLASKAFSSELKNKLFDGEFVYSKPKRNILLPAYLFTVTSHCSSFPAWPVPLLLCPKEKALLTPQSTGAKSIYVIKHRRTCHCIPQFRLVKVILS